MKIEKFHSGIPLYPMLTVLKRHFGSLVYNSALFLTAQSIYWLGFYVVR
jgi:hypothetical protein